MLKKHCNGSNLWVVRAATFVSVYGITWNVLIANYVEHEHVEEALKWFISMSREGLSPDATTFVAVMTFSKIYCML